MADPPPAPRVPDAPAPAPAPDSPFPEATPAEAGRAAQARRFLRALRWLSLFALAFAALAVAAVMRGEPTFKIHMAIATALGAGLSVLVGGALMTLMFLSSSSGHDDAATHPLEKDRP